MSNQPESGQTFPTIFYYCFGSCSLGRLALGQEDPKWPVVVDVHVGINRISSRDLSVNYYCIIFLPPLALFHWQCQHPSSTTYHSSRQLEKVVSTSLDNRRLHNHPCITLARSAVAVSSVAHGHSSGPSYPCCCLLPSGPRPSTTRFCMNQISHLFYPDLDTQHLFHIHHWRKSCSIF